MHNSTSSLLLTLKPIGVIRSSMHVKFEAPHQPSPSRETRSSIELLPEANFEKALQDLAGFERIWIISWFHRNTSWRPLVLPPRGTAQRRGVFATRSPHRPNPIGITAVELIEVKKLSLVIGSCDLLDGTPVLDIKPYISTIDSFPDARKGWLTEVEAELSMPPTFKVKLTPIALEQIEWLKREWKIDFLGRAIEILERDPRPHRTRRISRYRGDRFRIGCGAWKMIYSVHEKEISIERVTIGYPVRLLGIESDNHVPDREAQCSFLNYWPIE